MDKKKFAEFVEWVFTVGGLLLLFFSGYIFQSSLLLSLILLFMGTLFAFVRVEYVKEVKKEEGAQ